VDFRDPAERKHQVAWALALLNAFADLDGVHFDYIRYRDWEAVDADKMNGITTTIAQARKAIQEKYPGKFLTATSFVAGSANYHGAWQGDRANWTSDVPQWYREWFAAHPDNWYAQQHLHDRKLKKEWLLGPVHFNYQQDSPAWVREGLVDGLMPMQYTTDDGRWSTEAYIWKSFVGADVRRVYLGLGWLTEEGHPDWGYDAEALVRKIKYGRAAGMRGFVIFQLGPAAEKDWELVNALAVDSPANDNEAPFKAPARSPLAVARVAHLPIQAGPLWKALVFLEEGESISESQALTAEIQQDPRQGPCLVIGPWIAGRWSARYQYEKKFPFTKATISGVYKTEEVPPFFAAVTVNYYGEKDRIARERYTLASAPDWRPFRVPLRRIPQGAIAMAPGFGLDRQCRGRVYFAQLTIAEGVEPLEVPDNPGTVARPAPPKNFKKGNFFRLARRKHTWWFVTPQGKAFYSLGTPVKWFGKDPAGLGRGRDYVAFMRTTGFNSVAGWSGYEHWHALNEARGGGDNAPLPLFYALQTPTLAGGFDRLKNAKGEEIAGHRFPDPFDPAFQRAYAAKVRQVADVVSNQPWFAGWFADNEVSHRDLYRHVYSRHCAKAFHNFLAKRYRSIKALNTSWGSTFTSFEGLMAEKPDPKLREGKMYQDFLRFEREIVKQYIQVTLSTIRRADPDHLIFSNRFMLDDMGDWVRVVDLHREYDGIAVNIYPANNEPGLGKNAVDILKLVHERIGKPILIGEWSIPSLDSGLYDDPKFLDWSWDETVETQTQRARQAARVTIDLYNLPFIVGSHWFTWKDFDSKKRRANRGLFKASGQPWTELITALKRAHRCIQEHQGF